MTKQTSNKFSPEVRARAVRIVLDHEGEHPSRWAVIMSIAAKIGCTAQTLNEWVKKAEVDNGRRDQIDLLLCEGLNFLAIDGDRADQLALPEHRHAEESSRAGGFD